MRGEVRLGIADHLGWAVAVAASDDHQVVDRRRIGLVEPELSAAPIQRRSPYEARADAIMYRQELAELAHARGWEVHVYDARAVISQAESLLGDRAEMVLHGPRAALGPPWTKDHRLALGAAIVAGAGAPGVLSLNPPGAPRSRA